MTKVLEQLEAMNRTLQGLAKEKNRIGNSNGGFSPEGSVVTSPKDPDEGFAPHYRVGSRKLEIPLFNGDEVQGWFIRVDRYFRVNEVKESEKLNAVVIALEDRALKCKLHCVHGVNFRVLSYADSTRVLCITRRVRY